MTFISFHAYPVRIHCVLAERCIVRIAPWISQIDPRNPRGLKDCVELLYIFRKQVRVLERLVESCVDLHERVDEVVDCGGAEREIILRRNRLCIEAAIGARAHDSYGELRLADSKLKPVGMSPRIL